MKETKSEIFYLDDNKNIVDQEKATKARILEYDENGNRVSETYLVKNVEEEEKPVETLDDLNLSEEDRKLIDSIEWRNPQQQYEYALANNMIKGFNSDEDEELKEIAPRQR